MLQDTQLVNRATQEDTRNAMLPIGLRHKRFTFERRKDPQLVIELPTRTPAILCYPHTIKKVIEDVEEP